MYPVRIMFWMSLIWIIVEETTSALLFDILCTLYADTSAQGEGKNGKLNRIVCVDLQQLDRASDSRGSVLLSSSHYSLLWRTWSASRFMLSSSLLLLAMAFAVVSSGKSHELNR